MFVMIKDAYPQVVCNMESSGNESWEPSGDVKKFHRLLEKVKILCIQIVKSIRVYPS